MTAASGAFLLRDAQPADLAPIVAIYNASIPGRLATGDLEPVSVESRRDWFKAHSPASHPLIVAQDHAGTVLGWGGLSQFYGRAAYRFTAEISVYVGPQHLRRGIANALTDELLGRCPRLKIKNVLAFIFGHNEPSVRFFAGKGFVRCAHLPRIADLDGVERDLDIYLLRLEP